MPGLPAKITFVNKVIELSRLNFVATPKPVWRTRFRKYGTIIKTVINEERKLRYHSK